MSSEIARLDNVSVRYGNVTALEHVDFHLDPLDFVSVIGPNGGGKTTFLKVLLGLLIPQEGTVQVLGQEPALSRRLVGYVPQQVTLDKDFPISVWDVTLMGRLGIAGWPKKYSAEDREIVAGALQKVKLYDLRERRIGNLSGGQQQRVLIARALVAKPALLLLDEPTASVDSEIKQDIYELLLELNETLTIVIVSHDIGVVSSYTKTIACLNRTLVYHDDKDISPEMLAATYQCPVDLIAHGVPHRVLTRHP
ncbi:ABC transporter [candidate division KSB3 bacterium]|uniref:ABC transporter n=1 Tax=candidate division KSB3 bacterium TaxID=2044937 RepID=A0A2G6E6V2_9BACT|nr:MAG: ABC transporter [candidate division KSB3 bacterium]PIE30200.1 MAG: ABC transporter [candidate division KSB3 bacterium]